MIALAMTATLALLPAHPLGNFSVNQLISLELHPDRVEAVAVVDLAELPTLQFTPDCASLAREVNVSVDGHRLGWTITSADLSREPGAARLDTTRLTCHLSAPAHLDRAARVDVANGYQPDRLGWHELTATGDGVQVTGLPTTSRTNGLRTYPADLLSSPLDVRTAHLDIAPGSTVDSSSAAVPSSATGLLAGLERWWQASLSGHLTPLVGLLAVLLAIVLGAAHAALPGHGKTVMAIYLAGRAGRRRDALWVGGTVTATHTGGVLLLGLLLTSVSSLAGETVLGWLGIVSGAIVILVGASMLRSALRARRTPAHHHHHHGAAHHLGHSHAVGHEPGHHHEPGHGHAVAHEPGHSHEPGHGHAHESGHGEARQRRATLTALGIAGGLVPSPSALIVLLGAIALGRTGFGVLLVLAYGLGMAGTLTLAGLMLIQVRDRFRGRWHIRWSVLGRLTPFATSGLVVLVGLGLAARAALII